MATSDIIDNSDKRFTSELCQFLTSLAKTPETNFEGLSTDLTRLRDALMQEVDTKSRRGSEASTGGESSGSGTDQNMSTSSQDNSPVRGRQGSSSSSSPGNNESTSSTSSSTLSTASSASVQSEEDIEEADIPFNKLGEMKEFSAKTRSQLTFPF